MFKHKTFGAHVFFKSSYDQSTGNINNKMKLNAFLSKQLTSKEKRTNEHTQNKQINKRTNRQLHQTRYLW